MTIFTVILIAIALICCPIMFISRAAQIIGIIFGMLAFCFSFGSSLFFLLVVIPILGWCCFCSKMYMNHKKEAKRLAKETPEDAYARLYTMINKLYDHHHTNSTQIVSQYKKMVIGAYNRNNLTDEQANKLMGLIIAFEYSHISITKAELDELVNKELNVYKELKNK